MASTYTLTGNLKDLIGGDLRFINSLEIQIATNMPAGEAVIADGVIHLGSLTVDQTAGAFSIAGLIDTNASDANFAAGTLRYQVTITYRDGPGPRRTWTSGWFELTASADLGAAGFLDDASPFAVQSASAFAAEAAAHRDAVEQVVINDLGTTDGQTKTLIETDGTLTKAALSATYATGGEVRSKAKTDGTDQTTTLQNEINALATFGGGTILLPSGTVRLDGKITLPYVLDGTGAPVQQSLALVGTGRRAHGRGSGITFTPAGGTVLDMKWSSATTLTDGSLPGKLVSLGFGALEIRDITFTDSAGGANPFIRHTNTTVHIRNISGIGTKSGVACDQDLIIAGGKTVPGAGDFGLSEDSPYQGYGSLYENIWHDGIRRVLAAGAYFNQVTVRDITGWQKSGNATGGMVEIDPGTGTAQGCYGISLSNVLCEAGSYKHAVKLRKVSRSTIANVGTYDYSASVTYTSAIHLDACTSLQIERGYDDVDGIKPYITAETGNWRDQASLRSGTSDANAEDSNYHDRATFWASLTARPLGGGVGASLKFARAADAASGSQVGFSVYGSKWGYIEGTGGNMEIDTGTGGSNLILRAYGHKFYSHNGPLRVSIGEGIDGFKLGAAGAETVQRHATGIVKTNGRMRGDAGLSTVLNAAPGAGTVDNGEGVFWLDATPGATKIKFYAKDSGGTVRTGEIALT